MLSGFHKKTVKMQIKYEIIMNCTKNGIQKLTSDIKIFHKVSVSSLADTDLSNFKGFEGDLIKSIDKLY